MRDRYWARALTVEQLVLALLEYFGERPKDYLLRVLDKALTRLEAVSYAHFQFIRSYKMSPTDHRLVRDATSLRDLFKQCAIRLRGGLRACQRPHRRRAHDRLYACVRHERTRRQLPERRALLRRLPATHTRHH